MKRILTIAGSDSGGGAGIQADVKTITLLGGFGTSVLTALTAQNTMEVRAIHPVPPSFIDEQIKAVLSDIGTDAAKTGMLFDIPAIEIVADRLEAYGLEKLVVDPVMVAKSGDVLLVEEARETLIKRLIPLASVVTPNVPEAEILSNKSIEKEDDIYEAARVIHDLGPKHVLIKGGHLKGHAKDVLYDGEEFFVFQKDRIATPHTHGTGCVYSAAIATHLAKGFDIQETVKRSKDFVHTAIRTALPLGKGHGPTNIYAPFQKGQEQHHVLETLSKSLARLQQASVGHLMPEVQSNLGYALPFAEIHADVAAFPGRLVRLEDRIMAVSSPRFGASRHVATIILTTMRHNPAFRSAMNIRFSEAKIRQCQALGWEVRSFDRAREPRHVKEREGGTLEWGTEAVLSQTPKIPDVIYDYGEVGKEPMIRILGRTPGEVVDKVIQLVDKVP
jgi:hydroxymethylpyrimidine/phosphomethylpyrimidine kinase